MEATNTRLGHSFSDETLAQVAQVAKESGAVMRTAVPTSTGIGAPGTQQAPADLSRSPMSAAPNAQASAVPFPRASTLAVMQDKFLNAMVAGQSVPVTLQTNAFLEYIVLDVSLVTTGNSASVKWQADGPWSIFGSSGIALSDPANQAIITPISGFKLVQLNKYLTDTGCNFDPARDPGFSMLPTAANNGTGSTVATAGSASFRLVVPVELRRRDAFGALTNSAANEAMILTLTPAASSGTSTDTENGVYSTAPTTAPVLNVSIWQLYWTAPPASIQSGGTSTPAQRTPAGLNTMAFVRAERHVDVAGGGSPLFQLTSVGEVITNINWTLRTTVGINTRDAFVNTTAFNAGYANWPAVFNFAVNDFTTLSLGQDMWLREIARFYGLWNGVSAQAGNPSFLDAGVWTFGPYFSGIFDEAVNFLPASQYLATTAQTKCQVRGSQFGNASAAVEVDVRSVRPQSGATLYA
jgi:hypothetical protein